VNTANVCSDQTVLVVKETSTDEHVVCKKAILY